jgi:phosphate-selective porin
LALGRFGRQNDTVSETELIDRVASSTGLTAAEAARVVDDVVAWYREPVEGYAIRRSSR